VNFSEDSPAVERFRVEFEEYAERVIPRRKQNYFLSILRQGGSNANTSAEKSVVKIEGDCEIEHDEAGLPIFPTLDLNEDSPGKLCRVIQAYLEYVWSKSQPINFS
jgi:hypothetical protein